MKKYLSVPGAMYFCALFLSLSFLTPRLGFAGSVYLTGHDVLFHDGQNGYDKTILNFLRGAGTANAIPAASYDIGIVRGSALGLVGSFSSIAVDPSPGFGSVISRTLASFVDAADFSGFLNGIDVLVIPSHENCFGCDLTSADADILEQFAPEIKTFFNSGGDIFANAGADDTSFYNFLPPGALATATTIFGSTGFTETAEGAAIGITSNQINGFETHNRFTSFDSAFTVFETRGSEIVSIGFQDLLISGGGGSGGGGSGGGPIFVPPPSAVPIPAAVWLFGSGLLGLIGVSRRR